MSWTTLGQAAVPVLTTILGLVGIGARRHRLRAEIKANMELLAEVEQHAVLGRVGVLQEWLTTRIAVDTAKLAGIGSLNRKPIEWGSALLAGSLAGGSGVWAWYLNREGFNWWSVPLIALSVTMFVSLLGHFVNRDISAPAQQSEGGPGEIDGVDG